MALANDNPYSASQVLPEQRATIWRNLFYRSGIGFLIGAFLYGILRFIDTSESYGKGFFLLSTCVMIAASSTFTQSPSAKKSGITGIIAAIMLWLASILIANWVGHSLGLVPPNLKGYEQEWSQYEKHRLLLWIFLYAILVSGYFFLFCRKQSPPLDSRVP